jgi:hypothetical protein
MEIMSWNDTPTKKEEHFLFFIFFAGRDAISIPVSFVQTAISLLHVSHNSERRSVSLPWSYFHNLGNRVKVPGWWNASVQFTSYPTLPRVQTDAVVFGKSISGLCNVGSINLIFTVIQ